MNLEELRIKFRKFAIRIIKLADHLPDTASGRVISNQIIRSGTSPGANYRAACLDKSDADLMNENLELLKIIISSINTMKKKTINSK